MKNQLISCFTLWLAGCGVESPRPPVVVIVFDALGSNHVGHLGYERDTTPVLDALAAEGVSFRNCMTPAPYTLASIPSLMTGRLPDVHGVTNTGQRLRDDEVTLAEHLSAAGYRTIAGVSQPNGSSKFGNAQGFDEFRELWIPQSPAEADFIKGRTGEAYRLPSAADLAALAGEAVATPSEQPLFLYLHVLEPHTPYQAPPEFLDRWQATDYDGPFDASAGDDMQVFFDILNGRLEATAADIEQVRSLYDGNLAWADHNLGIIRGHLERANLWDEALVIVTSDHGEACWEHGEWGHNWELYDEFVGVPLVVKLPGRAGPRGVIAEQLVSTLDVVPTICELLDLPVARGLELSGRSAADFLRGNPSAAETEGEERELILRSHHDVPHLASRTATTKTIVRQEGARVVGVEHYRLDTDPHEQQDLFEDDSASLRATARRLREWYLEAAQTRSADALELTKIEEAILRKLGYTGD